MIHDWLGRFLLLVLIGWWALIVWFLWWGIGAILS